MNKFRVLLICVLTLLLAGCDNGDEYATQSELLTGDGSVIEGILERRYDLGVSIDGIIVGNDNTSAFATLDKDGSTYQVIVEHDTGIVYDRYGKILYQEEVEKIVDEAVSLIKDNTYEYSTYYVYSMGNSNVSTLQDYLSSGHVVAEIEIIGTLDAEGVYNCIQMLRENNIRYTVSLSTNSITEVSQIDSANDVHSLLTSN